MDALVRSYRDDPEDTVSIKIISIDCFRLSALHYCSISGRGDLRHDDSNLIFQFTFAGTSNMESSYQGSRWDPRHSFTLCLLPSFVGLKSAARTSIDQSDAEGERCGLGGGGSIFCTFRVSDHGNFIRFGWYRALSSKLLSASCVSHFSFVLWLYFVAGLHFYSDCASPSSTFIVSSSFYAEHATLVEQYPRREGCGCLFSSLVARRRRAVLSCLAACDLRGSRETTAALDRGDACVRGTAYPDLPAGPWLSS